MKKTALIFIVLLFMFNMHAQVSDLGKLVSGDVKFFSTLKEVDGSFYGYFLLSKLEKADKKTDKMEYLIFDKNLNKVANGEYFDEKLKKYILYGNLYPIKVNDKIIISKMNRDLGWAGADKHKFLSHKIIDISSNTVSNSFVCANNQLVNVTPKNINQLKKILHKQRTTFEPFKINNGFVMFERVKLKDKALKKVNTLRAYTTDKELKWEYQFKENKKISYQRFTTKDDKNLYLTTTDPKTEQIYIHCLDQNTGKLLFKYDFSNKKSKYAKSLDIFTAKNGETVLLGTIRKYGKNKFEDYKGYYRIVLDKNGNENSNEYFFFKDADASILKIKNNGKVGKGYRLNPKEFFYFKDGSISVLNEKRKDTYNFLYDQKVAKTSDFIILNFDSDFNLKSQKTIEKEKSKWITDYLYSQKIDGGNGVVFFYADKKYQEGVAGKNWVLGITTILNGNINVEELPMKSKKHIIYPYLAKEGYVLLREVNNENKNEPFDQIRLERLNY